MKHEVSKGELFGEPVEAVSLRDYVRVIDLGGLDQLLIHRYE